MYRLTLWSILGLAVLIGYVLIVMVAQVVRRPGFVGFASALKEHQTMAAAAVVIFAALHLGAIVTMQWTYSLLPALTAHQTTMADQRAKLVKLKQAAATPAAEDRGRFRRELTAFAADQNALDNEDVKAEVVKRGQALLAQNAPPDATQKFNGFVDQVVQDIGKNIDTMRRSREEQETQAGLPRLQKPR